MNVIELFLTGQMEMREFAQSLKSDCRIQQDVRELVPAEAIWDESHPIWKQYSFSAMAEHKFDLYSHMTCLHEFNLSIPDNLDIWGTLACFYKFSHPDAKLTTKYRDAFDLYLSAVMDCFDGPEVRELVMHTIEDALVLKTKKQRLEKAKTEIKCLFHVTDNQRPRWIQGPEWPMGKCSPMQYVSKKHRGEVVHYLFRDVDTGEEKVVEQYY